MKGRGEGGGREQGRVGGERWKTWLGAVGVGVVAKSTVDRARAKMSTCILGI